MTSPAHGAAAVLLHIPSVWAHQERCHNQKARSHRRSREPQRSLWSRHETLRRLVNLASATGSSSAFCTAGLRLRAFTGTDISKVAQQCYTRVFKQNKCLCSTPLQLCGSLWEGDLPVIEQRWYFMAQRTLSTHTVLGLIFDCANEMLTTEEKGTVQAAVTTCSCSRRSFCACLCSPENTDRWHSSPHSHMVSASHLTKIVTTVSASSLSALSHLVSQQSLFNSLTPL